MKNVSFTLGIQWFTEIEQKVGNEVLVVDLWSHKRASCAPDCDPLKETSYSVEAQEGRMGGFRAPWGCRLTIAPPGKVRFKMENECFVCLRVRLGAEGGVI